MGKCTFNISFEEEPPRFIAKAKTVLQNAGGSLSGDEITGRIHLSTPLGSIRAKYQVAGQVMIVTITTMPFFISCDNVQQLVSSSMRG